MGLNKLNHNFNEPVVSTSETTDSLVAGTAIVQGALSSGSLTTGAVIATSLSATSGTIPNLVAVSPTVTNGTFLKASLTSPLFNAGSVEKLNVFPVRWDGTWSVYPNAVSNQAVIFPDISSIWYYTNPPVSAVPLLITGAPLTNTGPSASTVNSMLTVGQSMTVVLLLNQSSPGYIPSSYQIDYNTVAVKWAGGTAPTASTNAIDSITLTIIKNAEFNFTVLGSATKFA